MSYKTLRRISTICLIILTPLVIMIGLGASVGKGGVLNGLDSALAEIEDLEKRNILHSPPEGTSRIALREIELLHDSEGVKNYIKEVEQDESGLIIFGLLTVLWIIAFIARKQFKQKLRKQKE